MPDEGARLVLTLPNDTVIEVWGSPAAAERDILERIVLDLFAEGRLPPGRAAKVLGLSYADFLDLIVRKRVPWPYGTEDFEADLKTLKQMDER